MQNSEVATKERTSSPLSLEVAAIKNELMIVSESPVDPQLDSQAEDVVEKLFALDANDPKTVEQARSAVEALGFKLQVEVARRSEMLKQPIATLAKAGDDGGPVAKALVDLKIQVEDLDPAKFDFSAGWLSRTFGFLPVVGKPLKRYFTRYEEAGNVIEAIMSSLRLGRETLKRDNVTLSSDQAEMRTMTRLLLRTIQKAQLIDRKLSEKIDLLPAEDPHRNFLQEEILFRLRQRIEDLQQGLLVAQQGILTMEIIIRNNKELMRGVDRALFVTDHALQIAVASALALANQKIVITKIQAVNQTTDNLLAGNAERLRTQGVEIHKMAASAQLSIDNLKKCFSDVNAAIEDISSFRREALPKMAQAILEMGEMAGQQEQTIKKLEDGNMLASQFNFEAI